MKHEVLQILQQHNIPIPSFIVVDKKIGLTPVQSFLLSDDKKYAVRSSFSSEDSSTSSFAGQFLTELNVCKDDLYASVDRVFQSMQSSSVAAYQDAITDSNLDGCVIVQEMVDADYSGVVFTANPIGPYNEIVFVVGHGLGNNVVEDKVNTTTYYYNVNDELYYTVKTEGSPILNKYVLKRLLDTVKRIKSILKYDVDIEFAIKNNHVFILQARPITTLSKGPFIVLDNSNIVESYPGLSLPLTQDFVKTVYHEIFYNLVLRLTENKNLVDQMDPILKDMVDSANGRIYYRISSWYAFLKLLPASNLIIPMWQKMLGVQDTTIILPADVQVGLRSKFNILKNFTHFLFKTPQHMDALNAKFTRDYSGYQKQIVEATNIQQLLSVYNSIKTDILSDWDLTLANDMYTFVYTSLAGRKNKNMLSDIRNLESLAPAFAMDELMRIKLKHGRESSEYKKAAEVYISLYGDRCLGELKLETKTYRTNPELLDQQILSSETQTNSDSVHIEQKTRNWFVKNAKIGIFNREKSRLNRSRIFGLSRSIFLRIGELLCKDNLIDNARDVFYLKVDELDSHSDLRQLVDKRKNEMRLFESVPAYSRLVFADKIIDRYEVGLSDVSSGNSLELHGIGTSTGSVVGEALVVDDPTKCGSTENKILITMSTDPGWVFLIKPALGIIAEKGSLLSHTAIISRELHKPAIVNVKDCTKLIHTGDIVELNTDVGLVKIIRKVERT